MIVFIERLQTKSCLKPRTYLQRAYDLAYGPVYSLLLLETLPESIWYGIQSRQKTNE